VAFIRDSGSLESARRRSLADRDQHTKSCKQEPEFKLIKKQELGPASVTLDSNVNHFTVKFSPSEFFLIRRASRSAHVRWNFRERECLPISTFFYFIIITKNYVRLNLTDKDILA
jgi:hypothetical protein